MLGRSVFAACGVNNPAQWFSFGGTLPEDHWGQGFKGSLGVRAAHRRQIRQGLLHDPFLRLEPARAGLAASMRVRQPFTGRKAHANTGTCDWPSAD